VIVVIKDERASLKYSNIVTSVIKFRIVII
jgi:hypothetical protein